MRRTKYPGVGGLQVIRRRKAEKARYSRNNLIYVVYKRHRVIFVDVGGGKKRPDGMYEIYIYRS